MLTMGSATRIYVATGATDMRKGFCGLEGLIRERLDCDPTTGHIFLFSNSHQPCTCLGGYVLPRCFPVYPRTRRTSSCRLAQIIGNADGSSCQGLNRVAPLRITS